jgi:glycerophosphoryl diester phosphodiesterase
MQVISHRGYWKTEFEKNTIIAFERSFSLNFGTETDLRDYMGKLVISHDIAGKSCISVEDFFSMYKEYESAPLTLALNIKADGLQHELHKLLEQYDIRDYFVFDMSVPDTLAYIRNGLRFYSRQSEYELTPAFYSDCAGIWLDAFYSTWYTNDIIEEHLKKKKQVAIVSPELHKREYASLWKQLKDGHLHRADGLILCTDIPEEAIHFFNSLE